MQDGSGPAPAPSVSIGSAEGTDCGESVKIPVEPGPYYSRFSDPLPQEPADQLLCKDETARRLARAVTNVLPYGKRDLKPFGPDTPPENADALEIALLHTPPVALYGSYQLGEGFTCPEYPDHPITKRFSLLYQEGLDPTYAYYREDVEETLTRLFGERAWEHRDTIAYRYFPEEAIYVQLGDRAGAMTAQPQLLSYREEEQGYSCEVILLDGIFGTLDGIPVTEENILDLAAKTQRYLFTFTWNEERDLIFTGLAFLPADSN